MASERLQPEHFAFGRDTAGTTRRRKASEMDIITIIYGRPKECELIRSEEVV